MKVERAAKQLEALGNPTRLQVYRLLVRDGTLVLQATYIDVGSREYISLFVPWNR